MTKASFDELKWILVLPSKQRLYTFDKEGLCNIYPVSTAKNGLGEINGSQCTPRGWHEVAEIIGQDAPINAIFIGRIWTKEIYSATFEKKDWILTRILRLRGLVPGFNQGGDVDSFERFIYIHGTPEPMPIRQPLSHGCIRMRNQDIIDLANWVIPKTRIFIHSSI